MSGQGADGIEAKTTETMRWTLPSSSTPGEKQVVTPRAYGQGISGCGAGAIYVYYEYTYNE